MLLGCKKYKSLFTCMQIGPRIVNLDLHCSVWPIFGSCSLKRREVFIFLLTDGFHVFSKLDYFCMLKKYMLSYNYKHIHEKHCTHTMYLCELLVEYNDLWMLVIKISACKLLWHWKNLKAFHKFWSKLCLHYGIPEISSIVNFLIHQQYILATMKAPVKKTIFSIQINIYNFLLPQT